MTRVIKFRAWDKNTNTMRFPDGSKCAESNGALVDWFEDEDLMQFTGVLDKNGKEIYEGDIIKSYDQIGDVYFERGRFVVRGFYLTHLDEPSDAFGEGLVTLEVIGSIYENPELLTV